MRSVCFYCAFLGLFTAFPQEGNQDKRSNTPLFSLVDSKTSGIDFNNQIEDVRASNILLYDNYYGGAGVAVADFDQDGLQDIFFAGNLVADRLYHNQGEWHFREVSKQAGILDDGGWTTGVTVADANNDGYPDIYLSRELYDDEPQRRRNLLYINNGDLTFTESAASYRVADTQRTRHASFLDYDKDGDLDLLLLTQPPNPGSYSKYAGTQLLQPQYHLKLYQNTGQGYFNEVSETSGVNLTGYPNAATTTDLNNDGWTDIYVANDFEAPDFFFINNRDGTFTNVANEALNHLSFYSMGVDASDINNDGQLDLFVLDMAAEDHFRSRANMSGMNPKAFQKVVDEGGHYQYMYNTFQLANGNGTYSDVAQLMGVASTDWSWANLIADFDNDGLKDLYVTNGLLRDIRNTDADKKVAEVINKTILAFIQKNPTNTQVTSALDLIDLDKVLAVLPSQPLQNYAFKNRGDLEFKKVMTDWGLDQKSFSNGAAYGDLDNDGDLDLVVNNINEKAFLYENHSDQRPGTNYLRVKLSSNAHAPVLGTRVLIYQNGEMQMVQTTNVRGIYSTSEQIVHFGLGAIHMVDSLVVLWPNSKKSTLKEVLANQTLNLKMEEANQDQQTKADAFKDQYFSRTEDGQPFSHTHQENVFDDFEHQVLLPHKLSQFGPALARGDVNGDGLEDVFIGAASGFDAKLYLQTKEGRFEEEETSLWEAEKVYEDVDALFVDVNGDGHQDLYVVSGGNEFPANDWRYADRLYLNDGHGQLQKTEEFKVVPISGSVVKACDYDQDGDMDLFVGGRLMPRHYPLPAHSLLLKNEGGELFNVTGEQAPGLENLGMVTDAVWSDYDQDGDMDLTIVGEWMPITLFNNTNGTFRKVEPAGLKKTSGWWFSLDSADFDQDGDVDYVAGNLGLNYKYKTFVDRPFDIYYNDFDGNKRGDIVLGYYQEGDHYPLRGFSCSAQQVPMLKEKIKKYEVFASLDIGDIYGNKSLEKSLHYVAHTFASSYVENIGDGNFKIHELPRKAQWSSVNDMVVQDFDGDENPDVLMAGNLFVSEVETPRNDAGTGVLLLGDGKGGFSPVTSAISGFFSNQDAKKLIPLNVGSEKYVMVANNDGPLQFFRVK